MYAAAKTYPGSYSARIRGSVCTTQVGNVFLNHAEFDALSLSAVGNPQRSDGCVALAPCCSLHRWPMHLPCPALSVWYLRIAWDLIVLYSSPPCSTSAPASGRRAQSRPAPASAAAPTTPSTAPPSPGASPLLPASTQCHCWHALPPACWGCCAVHMCCQRPAASVLAAHAHNCPCSSIVAPLIWRFSCTKPTEWLPHPQVQQHVLLRRHDVGGDVDVPGHQAADIPQRRHLLLCAALPGACCVLVHAATGLMLPSGVHHQCCCPSHCHSALPCHTCSILQMQHRRHVLQKQNRSVLPTRIQGPEQVYDQQLLFNWQNTFWGANVKLAQLQVRNSCCLTIFQLT